MKKCAYIIWMLLFLTGCAAEPTMETIADEVVLTVEAPVREMTLTLPREAVIPASQTDTGAIYQCEGYEIMLQTLPGGDLDATVRSVSGYNPEELTLIQTNPGNYKRWDMVWTCMGERSEQVGRAVILDDGNYHYVLCVLSDADCSQEGKQELETMFASFGID